jgi:hypothetical protein
VLASLGVTGEQVGWRGCEPRVSAGAGCYLRSVSPIVRLMSRAICSLIRHGQSVVARLGFVVHRAYMACVGVLAWALKNRLVVC